MDTTTQPKVDGNASPQAEQTVKIKYNHEEKEIPVSEAIVLAQKGLNYDKLAGRIQEFENDEALKFIDGVAKKAGVTRADVARKWKSEIDTQEAQKLAEAKGMPEDVAKELIASQQKEELTKQELAELKQRLAQQELIDNQVREFREAYPDVLDADIPDEVLERAKNKGIPLLDAYEAYQAKKLREDIKKMQEQLNAKNVNTENAESSMGSAASAGSTNMPELSEDFIKQQTPQWIDKHLPQIMAWMTKHKKE